MIGALTVAFFAVACLIALRSSAWALALVVSMYAVEQSLQASSGLFAAVTPLANVCIAMTAGTSAIVNLGRQDRPFRGYFTVVLGVVVGFYLWAALSLLWTPSFEAAKGYTTWGTPYVMLFILVAPLLIDGVPSLERFYRALMILGSITAVLILLNPAFTVKSGRLGFDLTASARSNPLVIGEMGGMVMIVAALAGFRGSVVPSVMARSVVFLIGTALSLQSGSRGQVLFAIGVAVAFFPLARRIKNVAGFFGTVAAIALVLPIVMILAQQMMAYDELKRWQVDVLAGGASTRWMNILDLFRAFATNPMAWMVGLGFNAFSWVSGASTEPYSHSLLVDMLTELGVPVFIIYCWWMLRVAKDGLWLLRRFGDDATERATVTTLLALGVYETLLVNKQGYLWAATLYFLVSILIARVRAREEALDTEWVSESVDPEALDDTADAKVGTDPLAHPS